MKKYINIYKSTKDGSFIVCPHSWDNAEDAKRYASKNAVAVAVEVVLDFDETENKITKKKDSTCTACHPRSYFGRD